VKKSFQKGVASEVNAVLEEFEAAVAQIRGERQLEQGDSNKEGADENESVDELTRDLAASLNVASDANSKKKASAAAAKKVVKKAPGKSGKKTAKKRNEWSDDESGVESEVGDENEAEADFDEEEVRPKSRKAVAPQDAVPAKGAASASSRKPLKEVGNTRVKA
jgi:type IV secretory pathway TrbL component